LVVNLWRQRTYDQQLQEVLQKQSTKLIITGVQS